MLANHWLDDTESSSGHLCLLGGHFDLVLQSCHMQDHRVPEAAIFKSALEQLGVEPEQVGWGTWTPSIPKYMHKTAGYDFSICQAVWLDADAGGVKGAEAAGMKAVLVKNVNEVLEKLSGFTGIQVLK